MPSLSRSTRICLKVCAPRFCFKVCAVPCYSMVDWLIEYKDMPQSLRTPMLFDGWLIDWVRGYASKSAHPVFASKSTHCKDRHFPETNRPNSANSSLPMDIVIMLRLKQKWRRNLRWYLTKNGRRVQAAFTQSINQLLNNMRVRRLWSKIGVRRLWGMSSYRTEKSVFYFSALNK